MSNHSTLPILYSDAYLVVVHKPSGLAVHRGWANDEVTATDLLRNQLGEAVSPVHRLDRATSGVLVFVRSAEVAKIVSTQFEEGKVRKVYWALVRGSTPDEGVIDHPIPRREGGPRVPAVTHYKTLARASNPLPTVHAVSWVEAYPQTGRLHQVRRHLKHISHPIIGDANYGKGPINRAFAEQYHLTRLALHAAFLTLDHPTTGEPITFSAALATDLSNALERLHLTPATDGATP
ncbi:MAG: pseudouridylate synthase [Polyangiaceae bacterium]|nr:pseudouridylate synthase [Polyangiaceae bacterium]